MAKRVGSCLCVEGDKVYRWRGDVTVYRPQWIDQIEELNLLTGRWSRHNVQTMDPNGSLPASFTSPSCVAANGRMYLFGGYGSLVLGFSRTYHRELYELDLSSFTWHHLRAVNEQDGPIAKYLSGMVLCGDDMLLIFGGFGVKANGVPLQKGAEYHVNEAGSGMWTNEMHLYQISSKRWINPQTTGVRPPPCAGFSFTQIDRHRVLLFAGRQPTHRSNDVYILNMSTWHWLGPINQFKQDQCWPTGRSLHTAACLIDPKAIPNHSNFTHQHPNWLMTAEQFEPEMETTTTPPIVKEQRVLMLWGQDNDDVPLTEAWIFHTSSMTWEQVSISEKRMKGRKWHSTATYYPTSTEAVVVTMGGFGKDRMNWVICPDNADTLVLYFGVPSLYQLCLKAVGTLAISNLSWYLPKHVLTDINGWRSKELNGMKLCQCMRL